jgi:hypothetical protein
MGRWCLNRFQHSATSQVYANEAHGIGGLYRHLYAEFDRFLDEECFNGPKVKSG